MSGRDNTRSGALARALRDFRRLLVNGLLTAGVVANRVRLLRGTRLCRAAGALNRATPELVCLFLCFERDFFGICYLRFPFC